jgi:hypothetical protein
MAWYLVKHKDKFTVPLSLVNDVALTSQGCTIWMRYENIYELYIKKNIWTP